MGEREAANRVDAAIERLGNLDAVDGTVPTLEVFRRTLDSELDVALRRVGRFGDGVLVGHVSMAVGLDLDRVAVLGMAEGVFPARRLEDSLLPDDEHRAANGELKLRMDQLRSGAGHVPTSELDDCLTHQLELLHLAGPRGRQGRGTCSLRPSSACRSERRGTRRASAVGDGTMA